MDRMETEFGTTKSFPHAAVDDREVVLVEQCEACETRPATGPTRLCTWCGLEVAGVVGEMQA
jgi:hypothetical protein